MKREDKSATPRALRLKSAGEPSAGVAARRMMTAARAAALSEEVLKYASVEWREAEAGKGGGEALRRPAK